MLMICAYSGVRDRFTRGEEEPGGIFDALMDLQLLPQLSGRKKGAGVVGWGCRDDKGEGDRIKTRRLLAVDDSEERRGCTVVSVTLGLRSENTHMQPVSPHTHLDLV